MHHGVVKEFLGELVDHCNILALVALEMVSSMVEFLCKHRNTQGESAGYPLSLRLTRWFRLPSLSSYRLSTIQHLAE